MNRQQFYRSDKWEAFRKVIIEERTEADGYVRCAICGKPILKKYDLIIHHKKELDDLNVNDALISLNPDNVECVHFKCHNQIHERFGYNKTSENVYVKKRVYIIYGPPCAGKSIWVNSVSCKDDIIVDMDSIWEMISANERYDKPDSIKSVAFEIRDKLYDIIKYRSGKWHNAYIITGSPLKADRDRLKIRVAADELIFIDTPYDECLKRAENRPNEWKEYIKNWFNTYQE